MRLRRARRPPAPSTPPAPPAPPAAPPKASGRPISFAGSRGVVLRGDAFGDPTHRTVLLLHGGGQTRHAWGGAAGRLAARGWHAVALDLRGHGESDWSPTRDYRIDAFAADVAAVAAALGSPPVLVGASIGGMAALLAAGEGRAGARPVASALALVDVVPHVERTGAERIQRFMLAHLDGFESLGAAADAVAAYNPNRPRPRDTAGLAKNVRQGRDGRWYWHWDPAFVLENLRGEGEEPPMVDSARLEAAARRLRCPVLLVRGGASDVVSAHGVDRLLEATPAAVAVEVPGAGHMVAGDRNDHFAGAVAAFLDGLPPEPS